MESSTIITINFNGIIQSVDKNCCKLFGYSLEELVGHSVNKIIPHPYKAQHDTYLENYRRTKKPKIIGTSRTVEGQHKDGSIFPIKISVSKIENNVPVSGTADSEMVCPMRGSSSDASNNNNASSQYDNTLFVGIIDKLEDTSGMITIDQKGIIVSCNTNVRGIFGYSPEELKGNNIKMLIPSPYQERHDINIRNAAQGGKEMIGHSRNVPALHKHGNVIPISLEVEPVSMGPITLFRAKIEKVNELEAVFVLDKNGVIASCNHNFVQALFGYNSSQLVGQNISLLIPAVSQKSGSAENNHNEENAPKRFKLTKVEAWKIPGIHKETVQHRDGSVFPVILEISTFHEFKEGKEMYSARIRRDNTEKKRTEKMIGDYYIIKTLGRGSYGKVKLAFHKTTQEQVAIKTLQKSRMSPSELERTKREIKITGSLNHPNIIKFHEMIETESDIHIVMEYGGRTLLSYVHEHNGLGEHESKKFFTQILKAVEHCHDRKIIHRDIKHQVWNICMQTYPQNILLNEQFVCKLIDFGLSQYVEEGVMRSSFCGTPAYASPQMLTGKQYVGTDLDVWSLGVVLYSMITGAFPFENIEDILLGNLKKPKASYECFELIQWMLQVDPTKRATLKEVINHKWITG